MPLEEFRAMLQETHDSTIRTEEQVKHLRKRMESGDLLFQDHDKRIATLETAHRDAGKEKEAIEKKLKARTKVGMVLVSALAFQAMATAWDKIVHFFKH